MKPQSTNQVVATIEKTSSRKIYTLAYARNYAHVRFYNIELSFWKNMAEVEGLVKFLA